MIKNTPLNIAIYRCTYIVGSLSYHSSLRLGSQMSKLRQGTRQMIAYLSTTSHDIITFKELKHTVKAVVTRLILHVL